MDKVRVRFAPSPTGYLHIGGLRTALYNWLFARQNKGMFIIRIEDTDRKRFVPGATEKLIEILDWIGLDYDEGPYLKMSNVKCQMSKPIIQERGKYRPYIQSKRLAIYQKYAQELVKKGAAYYCFCSPERLEKLRQVQIANKLPPKYDGLCRNLSQKEINDKLKKNFLFVIRLKFPQTGTTVLNDLIRGKVAFNNSLQDEAVLFKSDGYPTYHLANVVDDYLMKITHIIRGEEWLSSIPKHLFLYQVLGWPVPKFAHLPLLLSKDRSKLSKRHGDIAVEDFRAKGYLPAALLNFSTLLGWNPGKGEEQEIFTLKELVQTFSLEKIHKAGAIFDLEKLDWLNGWYIRHKNLSDLTKLCLPYLIRTGLIKSKISNFQFPISKQILNAKFQIIQTGEVVNFKWLTKIVALEQERMKKLSEIAELTKFFFKEPNYERGLLGWKKMTREQIVDNLQFLKKNLFKINKNNFNKKYLEKKILELIKKNNLGIGETLWPMRVALSGRVASPGPFEIAEVLGKDKTLVRLNQAIKTICLILS
jgi:glutamyl-tRNA synthetase